LGARCRAPVQSDAGIERHPGEAGSSFGKRALAMARASTVRAGKRANRPLKRGRAGVLRMGVPSTGRSLRLCSSSASGRSSDPTSRWRSWSSSAVAISSSTGAWLSCGRWRDGEKGGSPGVFLAGLASLAAGVVTLLWPGVHRARAPLRDRGVGHRPLHLRDHRRVPPASRAEQTNGCSR
jgi:hypothetical protein